MEAKRSAFVMSITPFDAAGALDESAYRAHLGRLRKAGVGVYVGGVSGATGVSNSDTSMDSGCVRG